MIDQLVHMDKSWLLAINGHYSDWADTLFWQISQASTWLPLYALLILCLFIKFKGARTPVLSWQVPTIVIALLLFAVAVGGADLICAKLIKPLVARPRPTHDAEIGAFVHLVNNYRGGAYGFCSNHAANTMACATLFSAIMTHKRPIYVHAYITLPLLIWVGLNCYSRMYLGVHYPLDILAGLIVGVLMALLVWMPGRGCLFPHEVHGHLDGEE